MKNSLLILLAGILMMISLPGSYTVLQLTNNYSDYEKPPYPDPDPPYPPTDPVQPIIIILPLNPIERPEYIIRPGNERPKYDGSYGCRDPIRNDGGRGSEDRNKGGRR